MCLPFTVVLYIVFISIHRHMCELYMAQVRKRENELFTYGMYSPTTVSETVHYVEMIEYPSICLVLFSITNNPQVSHSLNHQFVENSYFCLVDDNCHIRE